MDFALAREKMVEEQLRERGIADQRVLQVMEIIPREEFIPLEYQNQAYDDSPLPIGQGQTISQPYIVALMTELLELRGQEKVLEIGTGSGYQAAILGKLVRKVYSIERNMILAKKAKKLLQKLCFLNVRVIAGDGSLGFQQAAPYEAIILTAAPREIPQSLIKQLAKGGRLVAPVGESFNQRLIRIKKIKGKISQEDFGSCSFVPLSSGVEEK